MCVLIFFLLLLKVTHLCLCFGECELTLAHQYSECFSLVMKKMMVIHLTHWTQVGQKMLIFAALCKYVTRMSLVLLLSFSGLF